MKYHIKYSDKGEPRGSISVPTMEDVAMEFYQWMKCETRVDSIQITVVPETIEIKGIMIEHNPDPKIKDKLTRHILQIQMMEKRRVRERKVETANNRWINRQK